MAKTNPLHAIAQNFSKSNDAAKKLNSTMSENRDIINDVSRDIMGFGDKFVSLLKTTANIYKENLLGPIKAISDSLEQLAGVNLSNLMSYNGQLSTIIDSAKTIINEQIAWEQQLIGINKQVAELSKGSVNIYNTMASTRGALIKNHIEWAKWGGMTEGLNLSTSFAKDTIANISELSNDILLKWRQQNLALGIVGESSAKIAAYQARSGMSLDESLDSQKSIFSVLKKQFKSNALTSKIIEDIANSQFSILSYSRGNVDETARVAAHAHAWKVEIDEIYRTAMALSEAEKSIELARKAQLMFGLQLNARQLQFMAQTGQEVDLTTYLVDQFKDNINSFDTLVLSQKQFIADTIAGGDLIKARTMLLGRESELVNNLTDPIKEQTDLMKEQTVLLQAQNDYLASYQFKYAMERRKLWDDWSNQLDFIFGKQMSADEMSLEFERTRVSILNKMFTPALERIHKTLLDTGKVTHFIGTDITDTSSVLGHIYQNILAPMSEIVGKIGSGIATWWFGTDTTRGAFEKIKGILDYINTDAVIGKIVNALTNIGDKVINVIDSIASNPNLLNSWLSAFESLGKILGLILDMGKWMINNFELIIQSAAAFANFMIAAKLALIPGAGPFLAIAWLVGAGAQALAIHGAFEQRPKTSINYGEKIKTTASFDKKEFENIKMDNKPIHLDNESIIALGESIKKSMFITLPPSKKRKSGMNQGLPMFNIELAT